MHTIGVIAEYNPFHSGHGHHLRMLSQTFGPDCAVVCVMSGNWVQRGDAALADKWTRAELALRQGADLILELPTLWAVSSAESFARGGVALLTATGVVDTLSFGSEAGTLSPLQAVADCLESEAWRCLLRQTLAQGLSFPVARQRAATAGWEKTPSACAIPTTTWALNICGRFGPWAPPWFPTPSPAWGRATTRGKPACLMSPPLTCGKGFWKNLGKLLWPPISPPRRKRACGPTLPAWHFAPRGFWPVCGAWRQKTFPTCPTAEKV